MSSSDKIVKTRFAPSPTGFITIGNYRTALFNYLFSLKHQGQMLLRFEDTDMERSKEVFVEQIEQDLQAMGLIFDRTQVIFQSRRADIYEKYYETLIEKGHAYECYCSADDLALERKMQLAQGLPPKYSGRCRDLTYQQRLDYASKGLKPTLRFRVESGQSIEFDDLIMGHKKFDSDTIGDFIIRKASQDPAFFFSNAIDDVLSGITHVFRGDDHVTNTPRQILLMQALDLKVPLYGHFPLILGSDHKPLSKRTGSRSIAELIETGMLPSAINNYLGRLGHNVGSNEVLGLQKISEEFSLDKVSHCAAHFDPCQLDFWQRKCFGELPQEDYHRIVKEHCPLIENEKIDNFWNLAHANCQNAFELEKWSHYLLDQEANVSFDKIVQYQWSCDVLEELLTVWGRSWSEIISHLKSKYSLKGKSLFMPLRLILSGQEDGPPLEELYNFVPHDVIKKRIGKLKDEYIAV